MLFLFLSSSSLIVVLFYFCAFRTKQPTNQRKQPLFPPREPSAAIRLIEDTSPSITPFPSILLSTQLNSTSSLLKPIPVWEKQKVWQPPHPSVNSLSPHLLLRDTQICGQTGVIFVLPSLSFPSFLSQQDWRTDHLTFSGFSHPKASPQPMEFTRVSSPWYPIHSDYVVTVTPRPLCRPSQTLLSVLPRKLMQK